MSQSSPTVPQSAAHAGFVHLRVHTAFSLSEGAIPIKALAEAVTADAQPAVAITDTNNLFGALAFSQTMAGKGVQPILGVTLGLENPQIAPDRHGRKPAPDPLVLLVQNQVGYRNLMKLVSKAHLDSGDMDPAHIALSDLDGLTAGLIALTGGAAGPVGHLLQQGQDVKAERLLLDLAHHFPGRLYVEIQRHGLACEAATEERFIELAYAHDLPLVATNQAFFPDAEMYDAHDTLLCIAEGRYLRETERRRLTPDHRLKTAREMRLLFADLPEAVDNTLVIARRCAFKVAPIDPILPNFTEGQGISEADMLRSEAEEGLRLRLATHVFTDDMDEPARAAAAKPYWERLEHELKIINQMGFPGYFLIVADFIQWAKDNGIPVGPGRGSGAGSLVAFSLRITDLDPLRFTLLFERFLNPERVSMPDFDVDFCQDKRERVIHYVQEKYGRDRVAQIITFGKFQARMILRDVGRVAEQAYRETDKLCKMVPNNPANPVTLQEAIDTEPRLAEAIRTDEQTRLIVDRALKLEGLYRHASTHAAGVVIGDRPLDELVPLYRDPRSDMPVTQFDMKWVEQAGLVKFDFLGLKTLTVLARAVDYIAERGIKVDLDTVPLDDPASFAMLSAGDSAGVFQLESTGMRKVLKGLKPDKFEDIIAIVALYRPGPMDNIPTYIERKHGREVVEYPHEMIAQVLEETYGVPIYQEQVMQIAQVMAGYTLGQADLLRRAMGKKKAEEMDKQRQIFVAGAAERDVPEKKAHEIFDLLAKFAGYGFNKSHAAAYALVSYHTAYLKANYPVEFMAAIMSLDLNNTDKLGQFRDDVRQMGIELKGPDINKSGRHFRVEPVDDAMDADDPRAGLGIRYALAAIKGVGEKAVEQIVAERRANGAYKDLFDFAERVDPKLMNRRQLEQLAAAGAFDSLNANRAQVAASAEMLMRHAADAAERRSSAQVNLFGEAADDSRPPLPDMQPWLPMDQLTYELGAIGFHLSAHPLDSYDEAVRRLDAVAAEDVLAGKVQGETLPMVGAIVDFAQRKSRKGKPFGILTLSDRTAKYEVMVFSDMLDGARTLAEAGAPLLAKVETRRREDDDMVRLSAKALQPLDDAIAQKAATLKVYLTETDPLANLAELLGRYRGGRGKVQLILGLDGQREAELELDGGYKIAPPLRQALAHMRGVVEVEEV
ncbi:DNA polymerase III alpha subunit [Rhodothalassium salexigens DSM 2132]|uniref:DNA polymerase III subunit alpha n=1 Tax=Rhodothalassium salexigens DSM 2132 TaxID=1188247 RepID=A0A4R2PR92_RHOSA|nr:DNA polymerase III subunit alpha [Rhodothalassium salexigens]MBB4210072.1 DNA polymerase-3 subunit alpha [Rhodothalassium salexigens DSM 2132]MBK1639574.1 DNA polymerase III subunit alpha [Rhodothalassium salexigens DSM 2132]TCP38237.1 DNA polymerase III alpha subunit [Rhodothalassium salexigens DSM 2132]